MPRLRPNDFLDPRQYDSINARFYRADPADYFRMRIYMLLLAMGRADEVGVLLNEGIEWRELKFKTMPSDDSTSEDESKRRWEAAGIADAEVVYHHAAECLLRLVSAHVGLPQCPQLEVARMRTPGQFKRWVQSNLVERDLEELSTDLWPVFYGSEEVIEQLDPCPPAAEIAEARVAAARWVQHFAWTWLDRAPIYNTAKHGFALGAGEGGFSLGPMGPAALKLGTLRSGDYVHRRGRREGRPPLGGAHDLRGARQQRGLHVDRNTDDRTAMADRPLPLRANIQAGTAPPLQG
jgi:hypothetical protein